MRSLAHHLFLRFHLHLNHVGLHFPLDGGVGAHVDHQRLLKVFVFNSSFEEHLVLHLDLFDHEFHHFLLIIARGTLQLFQGLHHAS